MLSASSREEFVQDKKVCSFILAIRDERLRGSDGIVMFHTIIIFNLEVHEYILST